jgi:penicillin-binding protein 2
MNPFSQRRYLVIGILLLIVLVYVGRLFQLQVVDRTYRLTASNNVLRYVTQYPARGLIYDRHGELLVYNEAAYDLMINPLQLAAFDTAEFCTLLRVKKQEVIDAIRKARQYSLYKPSPFIRQISSETYANFQEKMFRFPGFFVQPRTLRKYSKNTAAHVLGYIGEVDEKIIAADGYYSLGDYIGISGVERTYETALRGMKGVNIYLVDVHNRIMGSYQNGRFDTTAVIGKDLTLTMDAGLQEYGEYLMKGKSGSIVAIEPSTGEILAMVSAPSYQPSMLVGRIRTGNFNLLSQDTLKPLFDRALMAQYPPGSTFKVVNGLIGLQEKVVSINTMYSCDLGYHSGGITVGCHAHHSPLNLPQAIQNSCNAYFCNVYRNILDNPKYGSIQEAFTVWRNYLLSFGFGDRLGSDFPNELSGNVPQAGYYNKYFGENGWKSLTVISMAIGQGELLITPVQMGNLAVIIANHGYYYVPHILKTIEGEEATPETFTTRHNTLVDSTCYLPIVEGMYEAVNGPPGSGATATIAQIPGIDVCGKTGTAQNPFGKDHSVFIAFAPKDHPRIAMAVYVENAGFGATYAAPIASLMIEKYLNDTISRGYLEEHVLQTDLIHQK